MAFTLRFSDGKTVDHALGKIVCVGRNYAEHAHELNNPVPETPLLFIKPSTSAVAMEEEIVVPVERGDVHFETELAILIGQPLTRASEAQAREAIIGMGLALDLTLRDVQARLKEKSHPWELAKGFDGACPLSHFVAVDGHAVDWQDVRFSLDLDGEPRQRGHSSDMLFPVVALIAEISQSFTLNPGDVVLTGTPKGVGPLPTGARLDLAIEGYLHVESRTV
ncbi:fumarylacetoacetate hydrolase family protein [Phytohalomonas tamaricis]|uniref:fumarylacetoacetate hydrolase family protein n=1 Tax=Phytohalomonas tamaricis TaxID=2081032 RepID=UPI000D0B209B|nr:fumarylacetoacetate hydrolase family protein [Phytohalomonas tamaricis]